jgi:hypothetical protein
VSVVVNVSIDVNGLPVAYMAIRRTAPPGPVPVDEGPGDYEVAVKAQVDLDRDTFVLKGFDRSRGLMALLAEATRLVEEEWAAARRRER